MAEAISLLLPYWILCIHISTVVWTLDEFNAWRIYMFIRNIKYVYLFLCRLRLMYVLMRLNTKNWVENSKNLLELIFIILYSWTNCIIDEFPSTAYLYKSIYIYIVYIRDEHQPFFFSSNPLIHIELDANSIEKSDSTHLLSYPKIDKARVRVEENSSPIQ